MSLFVLYHSLHFCHLFSLKTEYLIFPFLGEESSGRTIGQSLRDMSARKLVLPEETVLMVQSNMVHGCYSPLSKTQLEWQISINDITEQVETEQAKIMQVRP